ncbi:MAG: pyridoxal-dependent decarboxylase [Gemmatimonadaceae bacterium]
MDDRLRLAGAEALPVAVRAMGDQVEHDAMRDGGERALRWIEKYLAEPRRYRVLPEVRPGEIRARLPASPPETAQGMTDILDDFEEIIVPGLTHWNHPAFFGYFATSSSAPGIIAEMLSAAVDVKAMLWKTSPAATELEEVVTDWLRQMLGFDPNWFGMMTDTASMSTMLALAAAREARPELEIRRLGMAGRKDLPTLRVYASEAAHSSVEKAALALGFGADNVVKIETDPEFRMRPVSLRQAIERDVAHGMMPIACVATVGTTGVASIDPVPEIAAVCSDHRVCLHVDAAYAGVAAILPEKRAILAGVDHAQSFVVNPHKWLFTPFDCSVLYVREPEILARAFSLVPEYLTTREDEEVVNYNDYGVQLGRKFRALKLWMIIRAFGVEGLATRIRSHCQMAGDFARTVASTPTWHVLAPVHFGLVVFRCQPHGMDDAAGDALTEKIMHAVNETGEVFLSHTKVRGRYAIRLSIGNLRTELSDVQRAWTLILEAARPTA